MNPLVVIRPLRGENVLADTFPVGAQFKHSAGAGIKCGAFDRAGRVEFLAEQRRCAGFKQRRRDGFLVAFDDFGIGSDPFGRPS